MNNFLYLFIVISAALLINSYFIESRFAWGPCPEVKPTSNFTLSDYTGEWYEIARFRSLFNAVCVTANYTQGSSNDTLNVVNSFYKRKRQRSFKGYLTTPDKNEPGKLEFHFNCTRKREEDDGKKRKKDIKVDYWIIDTDYDNYSVVWSCKNGLFKLYHYEYAWILGREKVLQDVYLNTALDKLRKQKINTKRFKFTRQDYCKHSSRTEKEEEEETGSRKKPPFPDIEYVL
ncbi:hypothetical protein ABK040_008813 [Willaertia magna]